MKVDLNQYLKDLQADGWKTEATYTNKPIEQAFKAEKDGFSVRGGDFIGIAIWGPDELQVVAADVYPGMEVLKKELRHCPHCDKHDVDTSRYSFAGRACAECLPALKQKHEQPGWCN